jgi:hypothetical protein
VPDSLSDEPITSAVEGAPSAATILQFVDPTNSSTVLFDFNDPTGLNNPGLVKTYFGVGGAFALRTPDTEFLRFAPTNLPGGTTVFSRDPLVESSWRTRFLGSSYDALITGLGALANIIHQGGVLLWQEVGSASIRYIDVEPSAAPAALTGEDRELYYRAKLFDSPQGILISVTRQPYLRGVQLDPSINVLVNSTLLIDVNGDGKSDGWTYTTNSGTPTFSINADEAAARISKSTAFNVTMEQTFATAVSGDIWTGAVDVRVGNTGTIQLKIVFLDSGNAVLRTDAGSAVSLTPTSVKHQFTRVAFTSSAAPASTAKVKLLWIVDSANSSSTTFRLRNAQLEKDDAASTYAGGTQIVANDPAATGSAGRWVPFYVQGSAPAPIQWKAVGDSGAKVQQVVFGVRLPDPRIGGRSFVDLLNRNFFQCESGTLGTDTTSVSDAAASGGDMARVTHATLETMARRVKISATTLLESLRGRHDVWLRVKATAAAKHVIQLRWGASTLDPAPNAGAEYVLETTDMTTFEYVDIKLGTINVPSSPIGLSGVNFELWTRRESGTGNLNLDVLVLGAADSVCTLRAPEGSSETWLGSQLVTPTNPGSLTAGAVVGNDLVLDTGTEAGGVAPNAGQAWPVGFHIITFKLTKAFTSQPWDYKFRVRNITDSTTVSSGQEVSITGRPNTGERTFRKTFASAAGKSYQPQVELTTVTGGQLQIHSIKHEFIPTIGSGEALKADTYLQAAWKEDASSKYVIGMKGALPGYLNPGLNLLYIMPGDVPAATQTLPESVLGRTLTLSGLYSPRWEL